MKNKTKVWNTYFRLSFFFFSQATNDNFFFTNLKDISSRITNSHEFVDAIDAEGELGLELFLSSHRYHLIFLHSVALAVAVIAVEVVAVIPQPFTHIFLLRGNLGVFLGEKLGAKAVVSGVVLGV